jgi:hypothetical protein
VGALAAESVGGQITMPLSWNEIRNRAHEFSKRWEGKGSERAEAQSFWNDFFKVFDIDQKSLSQDLNR